MRERRCRTQPDITAAMVYAGGAVPRPDTVVRAFVAFVEGLEEREGRPA
ncbi:hypothetical protein ACH4FA_12345 [Streptomyces sp. NPDC017966]